MKITAPSPASKNLRSGKTPDAKPQDRTISLTETKEDADRILRDFAPLFKKLA